MHDTGEDSVNVDGVTVRLYWKRLGESTLEYFQADGAGLSIGIVTASWHGTLQAYDWRGGYHELKTLPGILARLARVACRYSIEGR